MSNSSAIPYIGDSGDTAWMLTSTALVLIMTPGLGFFYGGLINSKNLVNVITMSFVTVSIVTIQFVLFGFSFAFGPGTPGFGTFVWGGLKNVGVLPDGDYSVSIPLLLYCLFQMMFAIITPAIISGAVAERMKFSSWVIFVFIWSTVVYDLIAHMVWSGWTVYPADGSAPYFATGWLRGLGAIDFAGGTVVHMTSGFSALAASIVLGPRKDYLKKKTRPANIPYVILGTTLLWFGWFGFNAGSALYADSGTTGVTPGSQPSATIAFANTQIATASASLTWLLLDSIFYKPTAAGACAGAVVGLVVITPASGFIVPGYAIIVGGAGCIWVYFCTQIKARFFSKYFDDALDVFTCHGQGGAAGAFLTGLFATTSVNPAGANGAFYGNPIQLAWQLTAICITAIVSLGFTTIIMLALKYTIGVRSSDEVEELGLDRAVHGESHLDDIDVLREQIELLSKRIDAIGAPNLSETTNGFTIEMEPTDKRSSTVQLTTFTQEN